MGIQGFNTWFSQNNAKAYIPLDTVKVDHLYVDMNSILHLVLRLGKYIIIITILFIYFYLNLIINCMKLTARNMHHFHVLLYSKLDDMINRVQPRKSVFLAMDGPAPLAKLLTQRERRKVKLMKYFY